MAVAVAAEVVDLFVELLVVCRALTVVDKLTVADVDVVAGSLKLAMAAVVGEATFNGGNKFVLFAPSPTPLLAFAAIAKLATNK